MKLSALGALALMVLTIIICLAVFLAQPAPEVFILPGTPPSEIPPPQGHGNAIMSLVAIFILLAMFVVVAILYKRDQEKTRQKEEEEKAGRKFW